MKNFARSFAVVGLATFLVGGAASAFAQGAANPPTRGGDRATAPQRGGERTPPQRERGAQQQRGAKIGAPAPAWTGTDTEGKTHSMSDFKGKIVVMQWINPDCPVCRRVMEDKLVTQAIGETVMAAGGKDIVWIFVNSTNYMDAQGSKDYIAKNDMGSVPTIVDKEGTIGRMFDARTTPHVFVIDGEGVLRYSGAFDDDPNGSKGKAGETVTNYAVSTVRAIKAGETVSPDATRPYGCSVKYPAGGDKPKSRG